MLFPHQVRGECPLDTGRGHPAEKVDAIVGFILLLYQLHQSDTLYPLRTGEVTIAPGGETTLIQNAVDMIKHLCHQRICWRDSAEVRDQSQWVRKTMERTLHLCEPADDICAPRRVIGLAGVTLHPFATLIAPTCAERVLQV